MTSDLFRHGSWTTPWQSPEFPPEESPRYRNKRFAAKPKWISGWHNYLPRFFKFNPSGEGWPWGYVIYRTSFGTISDQDWTAVIAKIDHYCYSNKFYDSRGLELQHRFPPQPNIRELVWEGYRNVIVEDPILEFASMDTIRKRHIE